MRQMETSAIKKVSKNKTKDSSTFSRAIVAIYSPATVIYEDDPVFSDLVRKTLLSADHEEDIEGEEEAVECDNDPFEDEMILNANHVESGRTNQTDIITVGSDDEGLKDMWLISVSERGSVHKGIISLGLVSIDIQSHSLKYQVGRVCCLIHR